MFYLRQWNHRWPSYNGDIYLPKPTPAFVPALQFPTSSTPAASPMISTMYLLQYSQCPLSCLSSAQLSMALLGMCKFPDFHDPAQDLSNLIQPSSHRYTDANHILHHLVHLLPLHLLAWNAFFHLTNCYVSGELKNHLWWKPSLKFPGSHPVWVTYTRIWNSKTEWSQNLKSIFHFFIYFTA